MSKLTSNEISDSLNNLIDNKQDKEDYSLMTENKTIVGAINEIYGKELIANAIGEPLKSTDTFTTMSNSINGLLNTFKINMMNKGATVDAGDKFKQLIDKITTLAGEGGIQIASGDMDERITWNINGVDETITTNLDFTPTMVFVTGDLSFTTVVESDFIILSNMQPMKVQAGTGTAYDDYIHTFTLTDVSSEGFHLKYNYTCSGIDSISSVYKPVCNFKKWYAIGPGKGSQNNGVKFVSGTINFNTHDVHYSSSPKTVDLTFSEPLEFNPTHFFIGPFNLGGHSTQIWTQNAYIYNNGYVSTFLSGSGMGVIQLTSFTTEKITFSISATYGNSVYVQGGNLTYYAIGVGENSSAEEKPLELEYTLDDLVNIQYEAVDGEGFRYDATALGVKLNLGYIPSRIMVYSLDNPWKGYTYASYNSIDDSKTIIYSSIGNYFQYLHVMATSSINTNLITKDQISLPIYYNAGGTAAKPTSGYRFKLIIYK